MKTPFRSPVALAAALAVSGAAQAVQMNYTGPNNGPWSSQANWTVNLGIAHRLPAIGDDAVLGLSPSVGAVNFDYSYSGSGLNLLQLDTVGKSIVLNQTTSSAMIARQEIIGDSRAGNTYFQSAGTNAVGSLVLGYTTGSGSYRLSGSAVLNAGSEWIGNFGTGSILQSGGTHSYTGQISLGSGGGSTGNYNLSGGSLSGLTLVVGDAGVGTFTQAGGTNSASNVLTLGGSPGGSGTFNLSAGTLNTGSVTVGNGGTGVFNQTGGTHTVSGNLTLAGNVGASGTYTLAGGTLYVGGDIVWGSGYDNTFNLDGGTLGSGYNNVKVNLLNLGSTAGSQGSYTQLGGTINVNNLSVGAGTNAVGSFSQSSGSVFAGNFVVGKGLGSQGSYTLSGGTLSTDNSWVGASNGVSQGAGVFDQTGGTHAMHKTLYLGADSTDAVYNLSGGSFTGAAIYGKGTLNLTGGSINIPYGDIGTLNVGAAQGKTFALGIADAAGANSFTNLSAGTENIGMGSSVLQTSGTHTVGSLFNNGNYTFNGGSFTVTGRLSNSGVMDLGGGTFNIAIALNGMADNTGLLRGNGRIVSSGTLSNEGLVTQTGGALVLAGTGAYANVGTWEMLSGQQLVIESPLLGNHGMLKLNGGIVTGSGSLQNGFEGMLTGQGVIANNTFYNQGTMVLTEGRTTVIKDFFSTGLIQMAGDTAVLAGGVLTNMGLIQGHGTIQNFVANTGTIQASGGVLSVAPLSNANAGNLVVDNGSSLLFQAPLLSNTGFIRLNGGGFNNFGSTLANSGQIQVSTGASQIYGAVTNQAGGKIIVSGGGGLTFYDTVDVQNGAELRVSAGATATFFGQVLQRTGSLFSGSGSKFYEGGLSVGASPGLGVDSGDVSFGVGNLYLAEIGGTRACTADCATNDQLKNTGFDKYIVAGHLALGGTLKLASWNGFVGQAGQSFDLLDWGNVSGSFSHIDASGFTLAAGTRLDTSRLYTDGVISVAAAVPEPESWAMMLAGLSLVGLLGRRRGRRWSRSG